MPRQLDLPPQLLKSDETNEGDFARASLVIVSVPCQNRILKRRRGGTTYMRKQF
jgi:hypothetical protein